MGWIPVQLKTFTVKNLVSISILILGFLLHSPISTPVKSRDWYGLVDTAEYDKQKSCLKEVLWFEAAGESELGIRAVATVVKNRKNSQGFPSTYCKVIHQPKAFSYRNELKPGEKKKVTLKNSIDKEVHAVIESISTEMLQGTFTPVLPKEVLWYTHVKVQNRWTKKLRVVAVVQNHKFYSM